jgi:hypothetical protein
VVEEKFCVLSYASTLYDVNVSTSLEKLYKEFIKKQLPRSDKSFLKKYNKFHCGKVE